MSALQQQLAAIAATSTNQLDLKAQRTAHGKSLLFDPKAAVSQDFDTLYQICLEGFNELCSVDYSFAVYAKTLFSEQSKTEDRTQMTREGNEDLNKAIESFLRAISGRLLLKPAIKAIEWLVRRFRIHEENTEYTLLTFLPYHETAIFATLLSILPKNVPTTFRFLRPYLTSYANPPRTAIVSAATTTKNFLAAMNSYVLEVVHDHHQSAPLLSFWATTVTQALDGMITAGRSGRGSVQRQREEDILLPILNVLSRGLANKHSPEMIMACYMIIMVLVSKMSLEEKVLDGMLEAVVKSRKEDTEETCLICLAVIMQERKAASLPKSVAKRLLRVQSLDAKLSMVSQQCRADRLALGTILSIFERHTELDQSRLELARKIVSMRLLNDTQIKTVTRTFVRIASARNISVPSIGSEMASLLNTICESSNPKRFQAILEEEKITLEDLELRLGQVLAITGPGIAEGPSDDVAMIEAAPTAEPSVQLQEVLSELQTVKPNKAANSLGDVVSSENFRLFSRAYILALSVEKSPDRVLAISLTKGDGAAKAGSSITFLLGMTSSRFPTAARSSAWRELARVLTTFKEPTDMQVLLPYLIHALGDSAASVRRAAADCVSKVSDLLQKITKSLSSKVGGKELYSCTKSEIEWLSSEDAQKVTVALLVSNLEEYVLDGNRIFAVLEPTLNGKKSSEEEPLGGVTLKSSLRTSLIDFLASHAAQCPFLSVSTIIFASLGTIGKPAGNARTKYLLPAVTKWFELDEKTAESRCNMELLNVAKVDFQHFAVLHPGDGEAMALFRGILSGQRIYEREKSIERGFNHLKEIWSRIKSPAQRTNADFLLELSLAKGHDPQTKDISAHAMHVLRSVPLLAETLNHFLQSTPSCFTRDQKTASHSMDASSSPKDTRKRRKSDVSSPEATKRQKLTEPSSMTSDVLTQNLHRITVILELVDSNETDGHFELMQGLFYILSELQHYKSLANSNMVYLQSLTIGALLAIVKSAKNTTPPDFDQSIIRADLLVDCVRRSGSSQVQNSALLLISSIASWLPDAILHSVMPIFTFMESTLLRQGDEYSAHVIDQTIACVVPPLAASLRKKNRIFILGIFDLLHSFTAAFEHIPSHRRVTLFNQLIDTLGPSDALAPTLTLLFDRHPVDTGVQRFTTDLLKHFGPLVSIKALKQSLDIFEDALKPKTQRKFADTLFSIKEKSPAEVELTLQHLLSNIEKAIDNPSLRGSLAKSLRKGSAEEDTTRQTAVGLIEKSIHLSSLLRQRPDLHEVSRKVIIAALNLPPPIELVTIATRLVDQPDEEMRRTTLKAIQMRVKSVKRDDEPTVRAYLDFATKVLSILETAKETTSKQLAVACIDQITIHFGKRDNDLILRAGQVISGPQALGSMDLTVRTMSLHCLTSMVEVLGNTFIPLAPKVLPLTFESLKESCSSSRDQEALHNAAYGFICAAIERVAYIFTGDYLRTALELSHQSAAIMQEPEEGESRRQFYLLLCTLIDPRERFHAISKTWPSAVKQGYLALHEHVEALNMALKNSSKAVVVKNSEAVFQSILQGFDLRNMSGSDSKSEQSFDDNEVALIEQQMTDATISMVLKLNDATFRPLFIRFTEWAFTELPKKDRSGRTSRSISFYGFLHVFFERLKSIVTSYSSYILESSASILQNTAPKAQEVALTRNVLEALQSNFEYDDDDFWQAPSHFSAIAAPLANLLTMNVSALIDDLVIPTITAFASAASSPDLHKDLNSLIMQHLRSDDAAHRLAAVKCQQRLTENLGEEWLNMLAEMIPIISELQEDDDENVEKETHRWIKQCEEILGESLDNMLQ